MNSVGSISLLQITDLHQLQSADSRLLGVDTTQSLTAVLNAALSEHVPDALVVTGDIAHAPEPETYARVRALIEARFRGPTLWLAGNHDLTAPLQATRPGGDALEMSGWGIIAIDTHVDGMVGGFVADAEFDHLRESLASTPARHIIVAGHHPPLPIGTPWLDTICITNGEALLDVLAADARVKAYICGHVHQATATMHRGLQLLTTPSTCFQFVANSVRFAVDTTPPGWRWLELSVDGNLATRVGRATDFEVTLDLSRSQRH